MLEPDIVLRYAKIIGLDPAKLKIFVGSEEQRRNG
jgi:hypothetical protein